MDDRRLSAGSVAFPNMKSELYLYGMHTGAVRRGWSCERHLHHRMLEINLVVEGCQTAVVGKTTHDQLEGDLLVIPPMRLHRFEAAKSAVLRYFVIHIQLFDPAIAGLLGQLEALLLRADDPATGHLRRPLDELLGLLRADAPKMEAMAAAYRLLAALESLLKEQGGGGGHPPADELPHRIARAIEGLIGRDDPGEAPEPQRGLEAVAAALGIGERHCRRVFREAYGMSPREYLAILRQQEAMQLLAGGSDSVEAIAGRIGYENAQSFIRQFNKWTGTTPGEFRRLHRGELLFLTPLDIRSSR